MNPPAPSSVAPRHAPHVSVLVPTYNYARFLPEALRSVLRQDYPNLEILVSDDASTDNSAEVIRRAVGDDPRVRIVVQPRNLGMVEHWNWCLREARGDYVKFLFGDDVLNSAHAISRLVALLENHPGAVIATCARRVIDEDARPLDLWNPLRRPGRHDGRSVIGRCFLANQNLVGEPSAVLLRRSARARGFAPAFRQLVDLEFWLHLLERGDLAYAPEPLVAFRRHRMQQSHLNRDQGVAQLETFQLVAQFLDTAEKRTAAGLSEFDYRLIQFRTTHYWRKAARLHVVADPRFRPASPELPFAWRLACHVRHSVQRPIENLARSLEKRRATNALWPDAASARTNLF